MEKLKTDIFLKLGQKKTKKKPTKKAEREKDE